MSDTVIRVENLGKRYRIGKAQEKADTFVGQIGQLLRAPIDNFKRLRGLSNFDKEDETVFWALRDINFEVKRGEVLGIIGHNGAGKSTLLKILSRITEPTTGSVRVKGRISALLEVGTGFHPELTGRENIYMNGTILGMTKKEIDCKLDEIVDFSGVEKHIDTPVKFYSSGMKVRLGFAVAAHLEPEILVIDEVLAVGDVEFQRKCLGKMEDVSRSGRTVLFVSHNMGAVRSLCKRGMVLDHGKVSFLGDVEKAVKAYTEKLSSYNFHNEKKWSIEDAPG
ncbi:MAG: ABC transporter ATP-binding protein, partial [Bacteroidetes bacterium]